ncbi:hypothetical protein [Konateibacter massiliensis]|uniref:hypothetical protein n=1 Tax=Konateibacter massiliensis TaxID=2002841 RepID=UPI000C159ED9|nr:hypothetical protein [Konateibacter massiliensis]
MAKGYLDVKQLESMKKADLQDLAKKLGVSDVGTIKELAARISAVEVDIPEESELTEEEKEAAEQAAKEETEPTEQTEEQPQTKEQEEPEEKAETGKVKVKTITRYLDKQLNEIKEAGEVLRVSAERAAELVTAKVAVIEE